MKNYTQPDIKKYIIAGLSLLLTICLILIIVYCAKNKTILDAQSNGEPLYTQSEIEEVKKQTRADFYADTIKTLNFKVGDELAGYKFTYVSVDKLVEALGKLDWATVAAVDNVKKIVLVSTADSKADIYVTAAVEGENILDYTVFIKNFDKSSYITLSKYAGLYLETSTTSFATGSSVAGKTCAVTAINIPVESYLNTWIQAA